LARTLSYGRGAPLAEGKYHQLIVMTDSKLKKATLADLKTEAATVSNLLGKLPIIDVTTLPLPDVMPPKTKKRPKGWAPSLPTAKFAVVKDIKIEHHELKDINPFFTCVIAKSSWGRVTSSVRILVGTKDTDAVMAQETWLAIWSRYRMVQNALNVKDAPNSYVSLNANDIKKYSLPALGWTNAFTAVKGYIERKDVRDALLAKIHKRHFAAPENWHEVHTFDWLSGLALLLDLPWIRALTDSVALTKSLEAMLAARKGRGREIPNEVSAYQRLLQDFNLPNPVATKIQDALSVDDLNAGFLDRFPLSRLVRVCDFANFAKTDPLHAELMLKCIFSKEA
jgi:hypothetical protein